MWAGPFERNRDIVLKHPYGHRGVAGGFALDVVERVANRENRICRPAAEQLPKLLAELHDLRIERVVAPERLVHQWHHELRQLMGRRFENVVEHMRIVHLGSPSARAPPQHTYVAPVLLWAEWYISRPLLEPALLPEAFWVIQRICVNDSPNNLSIVYRRPREYRRIDAMREGALPKSGATTKSLFANPTTALAF